MSSLVQQFLRIPELVERYDLRVFIESGCEDGTSLSVADHIGLHLYTCDVDAAKVELCRRAFPHAQVSHAKSVDHLRDVLPQIDAPALIWLDAHFSPLVEPHEQWPVFDELTLIHTLLGTRDASVILVDDISTVLQHSMTDFDPNEAQGHPDFAPYTLRSLTDMFPNHRYRVIAENTGVLEFTPKVWP